MCWGGEYGWTPKITTIGLVEFNSVSPIGPDPACLGNSCSYTNSHKCELTQAGAVRCWGGNVYGELGNGTTVGSQTPVDVIGFGVEGPLLTPTPTQTPTANAVPKLFNDKPRKLAVGGWHSCVVTNGGSIKCWGYNGLGQLGTGNRNDQGEPSTVVGLQSNVVMASLGGWHTCAVTSDGAVKCWGDNRSGQLGNGESCTSCLNLFSRETPVDVTGLSSGVVAIASGGAYNCAVTNSGGVKCWGANGEGQLGDGTTDHRTEPVDVAGLGSGVVGIAIYGATSCAVTSVGGVKCWGANSNGQLGDGTATERLTPVDVNGLSSGLRRWRPEETTFAL